MITPLLKPIKTTGGTFYTFSSASEDLGLSLTDSQNSFKFSKYALLNIPNIGNQGANWVNNINFSTAPGAFTQIDGSKTLNDYLIESFQNYCLNFETLILNDPSYDLNTPLNTSERVFWKWLKEIGGIRFKNAVPGSESTVAGVYSEELESNSYNKVVVQIGEINITNQVRSNNSFTEVYIYVPSSSGSSPDVLFKTIEDQNYGPNKSWTYNPTNPLEDEYLVGRGPTTIHPSGLSILSYYDSDNSVFSVLDPFSANSDFYLFNELIQSWIPDTDPGFKWWFDTPLANSYYTDRVFNDPGNDIFKIESPNKSVEWKRSRLDGIVLDWAIGDYKKAIDLNLNNFGEFNECIYSGIELEFNAVLVYYDLVDRVTGNINATNLFGILFLDNVNQTNGNGGEIPRLKKWKSNEELNQHGNSYSLKLNLKFDINAQDVAIESIINEYNPYSLELYIDSLNEMHKSAKIMSESLKEIQNLKLEFEKLKIALFSQKNVAELESKINQIESKLKDSAELVLSEKNITNLINQLRDELNLIYQNKTSVNVQYNVDVLKNGVGIGLEKQDGFLLVSNTLKTYQIGNKPLLDLTVDFQDNVTEYLYTHDLILGSQNYIKIMNHTNGMPFLLDKDIIIYINDQYGWKTGQSVKIAFNKGLDMNNQNGVFFISFITDSQDRLVTGNTYTKEIGTINSLQFEQRNNNPIIEIICINEKDYTFTIDVF
jgi:hypothetical protein